jgi:hypothetical protein
MLVFAASRLSIKILLFMIGRACFRKITVLQHSPKLGSDFYLAAHLTPPLVAGPEKGLFGPFTPLPNILLKGGAVSNNL